MTLPFDKIYCIHLAESKDRYNNLMNQFTKLNIQDQVDIWWTCKRDISKVIGNELKTLHTSYYDKLLKQNEDIYSGVFNCSFEHYTIVKQAYLRGFQSILIMEDDIIFHEDLDYINQIFNKIPNDYDVIKFYNAFSNGVWFSTNFVIQSDITQPINYILCNDDCFYNSTLCYALSKRGMKLLLDEYDKNFVPSDIALNNIKSFDLNYYVLDRNILCCPNNKIKSQIV